MERPTVFTSYPFDQVARKNDVIQVDIAYSFQKRKWSPILSLSVPHERRKKPRLVQHSIIVQWRKMLILNASLWSWNWKAPVMSNRNYKPLPPLRPARCSRLERLGGTDVPNDFRQSAENEPKEKHKDIWKLFTEARQNILHLHEQRLMALEELDQLKKENASLLDRMEQMEANEPLKTNTVSYNSCETDKFSISSKLLLRIDSMVLTEIIDSREASELRRLVIDSRISIADSFSEIMHKDDSELLAELRHFSNMSKKKGFHIVHICAEMEPVVSVGSLASYVTGLSRALQRQGHVVEVILPKYACLKLDEVQGLRVVEADFYSFFNGQLRGNRIWTGVIYGIGLTFIEPVYYSSFFSGDRVYGYSNDFERFTYFSRASLDYIVKSGKQPDVIHIHNWETSIVGPLFWDFFVNQGLEGARILLTCQGLNLQCLEAPEKLALCGLDPSRLHRHDRLQDNKKGHLVNLLKGGVVYSNRVIIMSSMETKGHIIGNLSYGMKPTLTIHKDKVLIAPHGFERSIWDPLVDKFLPRRYSAEDMRGKSVCKISLQQQLGLKSHASMILVGCILPEVFDVDLETLKSLVLMSSRKGVQFAFLFCSQNPGTNTELESLQEELKVGNVRFTDEYDEPFLHLMYAGCDIMLCPTFDDLVLQVPLKAMKYGAGLVPVNFGHSRSRQMADHDSGSTEFSRHICKSFANTTLSKAIDEMKNNPTEWNRKIRDAMTRDFSWDAECCDVHVSAYAAIKE